MEHNPLLEQLNNPATQTALLSLLEKLPEYTKNLEAMNNLSAFGQAVLADNALNKYEEIFRSYDINIHTLGALLELLEKLPNVLEKLNQVENLLNFATSILTDETSLDYAKQSLKEYTDPVITKGKQGFDLLKEVQQEVKTIEEPIKLFTLMKWLKDPGVQTSLKYIQATLKVLNKNNE
ncbi:MAG: hypothetical protein ABS944_02000 [Solibacillus sp.]|uniref:hypothetical protein n=1 Tax=unclassified Solibacillus TaxID=2637870 RepID=UPI0030F6B5F7